MSSPSSFTWLYNRSLRTQLWGAMLVVLAAGVASTTVALTALRTVRADASRLQRDAISPLATLGDLQAEIQKIRVAYRDVAFDEAQREAARTRLTAGIAAVDSLGGLLKQTSRDESGTSAMAAFVSSWKSVRAPLARFLASVDDGQEAAALSILRGDLRRTMADVERDVDRLAALELSSAATFAARTEAAVSRSTAIAMLTLGACLLLGCLIASFVLRRTTASVAEIGKRLESLTASCLSSLEAASRGLAAGDLSVKTEVRTTPVHIMGNDELAHLGSTVNATISRTQAAIASYDSAVDSLRAMLAETSRVVEAARRGETGTRAELHKFSGAFHQLLLGFNEAQDVSRRPVDAALAVLEQVAQRDLSVRVDGAFPGDHERLARAINIAVSNVGEALSEVDMAIEQIAAAAHQVSGGSQHLAESASQQAASTEEITAAAEEQAALTARTVQRLDEARALARETRERIRHGTQSMQGLEESMSRMCESAERTAKIVKTIDEIAFQTNLLALNAAVEAARAGDAGRGFAVVADEVRQLAIRAASAARESGALIGDTVGMARESRTIAKEVQEQLGTVDHDVERVTVVVEHVADDCVEQRRQINDVSRGIAEVSQQTQNAAANAEEAASASEELNAQAASMRALVRKFTLAQPSDEVRPLYRELPRHALGESLRRLAS